MSKILEKATAHFRNQISGEMKSITVPEWDSKIWFKTVTNLKEEGKILELSQQGKTVEALVESLVVRARHEDGSKMFTMPDRVTLMNEVDPRTLIRIVSEMNGVDDAVDLSQDAVEKN